MKIIEDEFPEIAIRGTLMGIVSRCYLGDPYEVHTLDISGNIIEHYKQGEPLPEYMEKARGLALHAIMHLSKSMKCLPCRKRRRIGCRHHGRSIALLISRILQ